MNARELDVSRRGFLRAAAAAGGGLVLSLRLPEAARAGVAASDADPAHAARAAAAADPAHAERAGGPPPGEFAPNAFVRIAADDTVTVVVNKAEMGQGVSTSLAMALAEDLEADWTKVRVEFAPAHPDYVHPGFPIQYTGGSTSTAGMTEPMRRAGAAARTMLVAAAAQKWGVPTSECSAENGAVAHAKKNLRASYGELAALAAAMPVPERVELKDAAHCRLLGRAVHRVDTAAKIAGTARFALDVYVEGVRTALVLHAPTFTAKVKAIDAAAARAVKGVSDVIDLGNAVAVVADSFWTAKTARERLDVQWDLGGSAELSTDALRARYRELARTPGLVARDDGDAAKALGAAAKQLVADYELPFLAHAPLEPLNCVVVPKDGAVEVWTGSQFQTGDQGAVATVFGIEPAKVALHTTFLGGGFGRRANPASDYLVEAARIAKATKSAIKLVWTREDDMRSGYYRPMWHDRLEAGLDAKGGVVAWRHRIVGQSILADTPFEAQMVQDGIDGSSVEGAVDIVYTIPNVRVELHTTKSPVPTLWWRSVGHSHTAFAVESFVDEVAHARGTSPLALRRELLARAPRHLGVLELAVAKSGFDAAPPAGRARGLAVHASFGSWVAVVLEVSLVGGAPRVHKATVAIDCGRVINPDTVKAQLQGAVGFALTAALHGEITLQAGRVEQSNFHDYPLLRIGQMPAVDVHVVPSDEPPSGVGEPGVPPVAPALANALFALTGVRVRRLPIRPADLR